MSEEKKYAQNTRVDLLEIVYGPKGLLRVSIAGPEKSTLVVLRA
jgi:hypothetical protein